LTILYFRFHYDRLKQNELHIRLLKKLTLLLYVFYSHSRYKTIKTIDFNYIHTPIVYSKTPAASALQSLLYVIPFKLQTGAHITGQDIKSLSLAVLSFEQE